MYNEDMRFEVPQFIEVEDKIIGPFTWKQFIYLAGGVGLAVVLFLTAPFIIFLLVGAPVGILAGLLAFYPVNNRPFSTFLESFVQFLRATKYYQWKKKGTGVYGTENSKAAALPPQESPHAPVVGTTNLSSLSRKLELEAITKQE